MRKVFLLLFFTSLLFSSSDRITDFIIKQVEVEKVIQDQNRSIDDLQEVIDAQNSDYSDFLTSIIDDSDATNSHFKLSDEILKLQKKIQVNRNKKNTLAQQRDEILLEYYLLIKLIRKNIIDLTLAVKNRKTVDYIKSFQKIIDENKEYMSSLNNLDDYVAVDNSNIKSPIMKKAKENLEKLKLLMLMDKSFINQLTYRQDILHYNSNFYDARLKKASLAINQTSIAQKINGVLSYIYLDLFKVLFSIAIIIAIFIVRKIIYFGVNLLLGYMVARAENVKDIFKTIAKTLEIFIFILAIHAIMLTVDLNSEVNDVVNFTSQLGYVLIVTILVYQVFNSLAMIKISEHQDKEHGLRKEVINLLITGINVVIISIGFLIGLRVYGFDLTAILSGLGIGGLAVAFAAKDTIANFFGSLSILFDNSFSQGDWIESSGVEGTVVEIGLRSTTIRTFDNALITMPNSQLANADIKNWSKRRIGRRIKMHIGVTYESNFDDIKVAIKEIRKMLTSHPKIATSKTKYLDREASNKLISKEDFRGVKRNLLVYLDNYSESSIDILIYCFSRSVQWVDWLEVKEDVMFKIADIIKRNNLEFAYPAMSVHVNKDEDEKQRSVL
jgi:MscS family membrane protein